MKSIKRTKTTTVISTVLATILVIGLMPVQVFADVLSDNPPEVVTGHAECISSDAVAITLSSFKADAITEYGIEVATDDLFSDAVVHIGTGAGELFLVNGLDDGTTYYYRSYLYCDNGTVYYGDTETFSTPPVPIQGTTRQSKSQMVADIAYMNSLLSEFDIDAPTLVSLPEKDPGFYEELAGYANISSQSGTLDFSTMPTQATLQPSASPTPVVQEQELAERVEADEAIELEVIPEEVLEAAPKEVIQTMSAPRRAISDFVQLRADSELVGARFEYACYIAEVNFARDRDAVDLEDEVVYMYLSHYIDMQPRDLGTTVDYNSNSGKLSAWITYYDREVYDSYLNVSGKWVVADSMRVAADALYSLGSNTLNLGTAASAVSKSTNFINTTLLAATIYKEGEHIGDTGEAINAAINSLNDDKTAQEVVDDIYTLIGGHNYEKAVEDFIVSTALSVLLSFGPGTSLIPLPITLLVGTAVFTVNMTAMLSSDLTSYIYWLQMEQSLSGRVPGRILRYYGMW